MTDGAASSNEEDIENRKTILAELQIIRISSERTEEKVDKALEEVKGFRYEFASVKDHMTEVALEVADIRGLTPNGLRGKRVLVVEDAPDLLTVINRLLSKCGILPFCVATKREAEQLLLNEGNFDIALVDLRIPTTDVGIELCRWICRAYRETKVVVMSGQLTENVDRMPVGRLEKPFTGPKLIAALNEALGHEAPSLRQTERPPAAVVPIREKAPAVFVPAAPPVATFSDRERATEPSRRVVLPPPSPDPEDTPPPTTEPEPYAKKSEPPEPAKS